MLQQDWQKSLLGKEANKMKFKKDINKKCPFFQEDCLQDRCKMYHEDFDRCEISLITYNLYILAKQLKPVMDPK